MSSRCVLLAVLLLVSAVPPVLCQPFYAVCFTLSSSLLTSPLFPWSISVSGTLNVSLPDPSSGLVRVLHANTVRSSTYQGRTVSVTPTGDTLLAAGSYQGNDNLLSLTPPYLTAAHSLAFVFPSTVYSAYGPSGAAVSVYNDSTFGLLEDTSPPNDGVLASITSSFTLTPSTVYSSDVHCPLPAVPSPTAVQLQQLSTPVVYSFCYLFTGGPGDGSSDPSGAVWTITAQGNFTTSSYTGTGSAGQGSVLSSVSGVRLYTAPDGTLSSATIAGLAPVNPLHGSLASNVLYTAYPYLDTYGAVFTSGLTSFVSEATPLTSPATTLAQVYIDSAQMFNEYLYSADGTSYWSPVGSIEVVPVAGGDVSTLQCSFTAGTTLAYSFCYTLVSDATANAPFSIVAYGVFTAAGPQIRHGRPSMSMQTMTGVRIVTNASTSVVQNIIRLVYVNGDEEVSEANILNDNLVFLSSPFLSDYGFDFSLSTNALYPDHTASTADINLSGGGQGEWYEWPAVGTGSESSIGSFNWSRADDPTVFPCSPSPTQATPPYQPSISVPFCYTAQTSGGSLMAVGTLMLYSASIAVGGRSALAVQSANGTRTFQAGDGALNVVAIEGVSADQFPSVVYVSYNQLVYGSAPFVDTAGLLLQLAAAPAPLTPDGAIAGDAVVHLLQLSNGSIVEQWETAGAQLSAVPVTLTVGSAAVSCAQPSLPSSGGGSSGLSGGKIAGAVVGSVVGAFLLCLLCLCLLRSGTKGADAGGSQPHGSSAQQSGPAMEMAQGV